MTSEMGGEWADRDSWLSDRVALRIRSSFAVTVMTPPYPDAHGGAAPRSEQDDHCPQDSTSMTQLGQTPSVKRV